MLEVLACCIHDHRYKIGGTKQGKIEADRELPSNILFFVKEYEKKSFNYTEGQK